MKNNALALVIVSLIAGSAARADVLDTHSEVVSLPAFVVEATRVDLPSADLSLSVDASLDAAVRIANRTSDRALDRLKDRLSHGGRSYARGFQGRPRARA
jgi:hypothetical protein